jgi:hypothetical protein
MFILRRVTSENGESNTFLGKTYNLIHFVHQSEEFKKTKEVWGVEDDDMGIYAFICHDEGGKLIPLYKSSSYYVMTDNGNTFANVTNRF